MTGRGLRGRHRARLMLAIAIGLDSVVGFLALSAPPTIGPLYAEPPSVVGWLVPAVGVIANVLGLVWMIRIVRSIEDAEAHPSFLRSRGA